MTSARPFFEELRRRKVFQAAAWYGGIAAATTQVLDLVANRFGLAPALMQGVILLGLAGLPVACVVAWFYDLTIAGLARTREASGDVALAVAPWGPPSLWFAIAAGALLMFGSQQAWRVFVAPAERPGIAVLPFDALGVEANHAFAGGLHAAVLDELGSISGLRVIARTSALRFADQKPDLREVGRILGVPYLLEGSVQREVGRLRVHAQLIDAATNEHLWSATYDRDADDIFGVQNALARDIAARLRVTLLADEAARADTAPSDDRAAYEAYLRAEVSLQQYLPDQFETEARPALEAAIAGFDEALRRDPRFALAHAERARALIYLWFSFWGDDPSVEPARDDALVAARTALALAPDLGEAHRALGLYYYWGLLDYPRADQAFARARDALPSDPSTAHYLGLLRRRQNQYDEAIALLGEAARLDPEDESLRLTWIQALYFGQRYDELEHVLADLATRYPQSGLPRYYGAFLAFCRDGDTEVFERTAQQAVRPIAAVQMRWYAARLDGRLADALRLVEEWNDEHFGLRSRQVALAESRYLVGDTTGAALATRPLIEKGEAHVRSAPSRAGIYGGLPKAYLFAGRADDARRAAAAALENTPLASGAIDHWQAVEEAAEVHAALGDADLALRQLQAFQDGPLGHCGHWLRRHPLFAKLRADPRFESIARQSDLQVMD
jgi:serine/threonine-protein kinase